MSQLRVLVADDEPLARQILVDLLRRDADVADIEEYADGPSARRAAESRHFDVAFIDIEMPEESGLDVVTGADIDIGAVVFVTAFSEYAVRAFDVDAVDYLLKPFSNSRFAEALERAKRRARSRQDEADHGTSPDSTTRFLSRVSFKDGDTSYVVPVDDILWMEAQDYYVRLHLAKRRHLIRATLADLERRLDPNRFIRVHRGAVVNVDKVSRLVERDGLVLVLSNGTELAVSRARRRTVRQALRPSLRS